MSHCSHLDKEVMNTVERCKHYDIQCDFDTKIAKCMDCNKTGILKDFPNKKLVEWLFHLDSDSEFTKWLESQHDPNAVLKHLLIKAFEAEKNGN